MTEETGKAWLLNCGGLRCLIGQSVVTHLIEAPDWIRVPGLPTARNLFFQWYQSLIPTADLSIYKSGSVDIYDTLIAAAIVVYADPDNTGTLGGIGLSAAPRALEITNAQTVEADEHHPAHPIAIAWAQLSNGERVPLVDVAALFNQPPATPLQKKCVGPLIASTSMAQ